ncbi:MAG: 3-dehydroquinate dehydratase [Deltaproteobacteria bacterium]|nr:MAG: 3-dehydroquinate dehydratase [Deltaproteobacteria bacterium]
MLDELFQLSQTFQQLRNRSFRRYFLRDHSLNNHFSIILGQRGIGKTTVMIQHLLDQSAGDRFSRKVLYLQSDHFLVAPLSLYEIADEFYKMGGKLICFDEIHKYRDWSMELKSITDTFPDLRIVASGSSALEIGKGSHDLSRRALVYNMYGLSFREYITMTTGIDLDRLSLETLLSGHQHATDGIVTRIEEGGEKILALFSRYLATGFYPYFQEYADSAQFYLTLEQNIHTTLEADLPAIYPSLNGASISKIKRLLAVISTLVPYTPDMKKLKKLLEIGDERTLKTYLKHLEDAGIVLTIAKSGKGLRPLEKPAKIYLNNPNLYYALASTPDRGAIRETFFLNMLRVGHQVSVPERGDFLVDETLTFEVGGKNKKSNQIQGVEQAWLVLDNLEIGTEKRIPLWLFGFLY